MKRLWKYMEGRKGFAALMVLVGAGNAAAQTGGWLLVRNAIDKGITVGDERHLTIVVGIYLCVAAAGWLLQAWLIRGLATIGQAVVIGVNTIKSLLASFARIWCFNTLPASFFGSASQISIRSGILNLATPWRISISRRSVKSGAC